MQQFNVTSVEARALEENSGSAGSLDTSSGSHRCLQCSLQCKNKFDLLVMIDVMSVINKVMRIQSSRTMNIWKNLKRLKAAYVRIELCSKNKTDEGRISKACCTHDTRGYTYPFIIVLALHLVGDVADSIHRILYVNVAL